jgi:hypothetical protein
VRWRFYCKPQQNDKGDFAMPGAIPAESELCALVGDLFYQNAQKVQAYLDAHYDLDAEWDKSEKHNTWQCRYRHGGKTLCTLLYKPGEAVCLVIFGAAERDKVQAVTLSPAGQATYDAATTYHDGKWVWFSLTGDTVLADIQMLLPLKRRQTK